MQNPPASAEKFWLARLVNDASLEVTVRDKDAARILRDRLPAGARVHVTYLSNASYADTIAQSKALAVAGFDPIPHLAARSLRSEAELSDYLARLAGEAGATRVLLVAGDLETPLGPFAGSIDVLKTGRFERNGISGIGFAAHPEGHPVVADAVMAQALADKVAYATQHGLEAEIVTQFCFEAAPIVTCLRSLQAGGIDAPVRIGAAAPAEALRMMKVALRCGIGPSLRALERHGARLGGVMGTAGPEGLVEELARALAVEDFGAVVGMHFFVFGGVERSTDWLVNWRGALKGI
ncbi:MAG: hypothetical protein ABL883_00975 [Terricaulis sp.]